MLMGGVLLSSADLTIPKVSTTSNLGLGWLGRVTIPDRVLQIFWT